MGATEWELRLDGCHPAAEGRHEALTTLANGIVGTRGALAESTASDVHYPGTYAAGLFNRLVSVVEGRRLEHESMVNLPNWLPLTFRIGDGPWFAPGLFEVVSDARHLDLRAGVLHRRARVRDPEGRTTTLAERRIVSMARTSLGAVEWVLTPDDWSGELTVRSGVDARVENSNVAAERGLAVRHLEVADVGEDLPDLAWLVVETVQSHRRAAEAVRTRLRADDAAVRAWWSDGDRVGHDLTIDARQGRPVVVEKVAGLVTSSEPAISEPGVAARTAARTAPVFEVLVAEHELAWRHLWERCHLDLGEDHVETTRLLNLHVFHVLQTLSPHLVDRDLGVPARGLHGEGYRGHIFWDDLFVFPFLNLRLPALTRELLLYRYRRLTAAKLAAAATGKRGALYPWQSGSDGREETPTQLFNPRSGRWMPDNSCRQRHVSLAIAHNVWQYVEVTDDADFLVSYGAEMLVEIARFWADLATFGPDDHYHLRGVMGPDEFHDGYPDRPGEGIDDNAYTNVMASWVLQRAMEADRRLNHVHGGQVRERLGLGAEEIDRWDEISRRLHVPFLDGGVIAQFDGFGDLEELDWDAYRARYGNIGRLDLILEAEGDSPNRYQLCKQADALMLFYLFTAEELEQLFGHLGIAFDPATIPATVEYYLSRSSDGSTLSRVAHAWVLSRSDRARSWEVFQEALVSDVDDTQGGTTREGVHLGAMAGTIDLVQRCYTGIDARGGVLWFNPRLPAGLNRLCFTIGYRGHRLDVTISDRRLEVSARHSRAAPVRVGLVDRVVVLEPGEHVERTLGPRPLARRRA